MNILITGGTGLLGKALTKRSGPDIEILATYNGDYMTADGKYIKYLKIDVTDLAAYKLVFNSFRPKVVIHTASIGSPDFAEKNRDITWKINVEGTRNMITLCEQYKAAFIYISSNGIYDGEFAPYDEDDVPEPINYYGQTKLEGENLTSQAKIPNAIVRPILMYGWNNMQERDNIVTSTLKKLQKAETVYAYDDVFSNPLYTVECAKAIWRIIDNEKYGIFNVAGADVVSIFQLLQEVAQAFGYDPKLVRPVKQGYFNELVKRPKNTSFNTEKMRKELKLEPLSLAAGLIAMKNDTNGINLK